MKLSKWTAAIALALSSPAAAQHAPPAPGDWVEAARLLAPHHARYAVSARKIVGSGYVGARGAMAFSLERDCEEWSMRQGYRVNLLPEDGDALVIDRSYETTESLDGASLSFRWRDFEDGDATRRSRGAVYRDGEGAQVTAIGEQGPDRYALPAETVFPVGHMAVLARAMRSGEPLAPMTMFDGLEPSGWWTAGHLNPLDAKTSVRRDALIGDLGENGASLLGLDASVALLSFYPLSDAGPTPDYEVEVLLLANGVALEMVFDYGDFALAAELIDYEEFARPECPSSEG